MEKNLYIKPLATAIELASQTALMEASLLPLVTEFDSPQIEDVEIVNYEW